MSELDFSIEHVTAGKIKHVDALSKRVGLSEETQLMRKELMIREQRKDSFCKEKVQNRLTTNGEHILDMDGVLYRRVNGKQSKMTFP